MGNANAFYNGMRMYADQERTAYERERQAKLDAVAEERLNRERQGWAEQDRRNAELDAQREELISRAQQPLPSADGPQGWAQQWGLTGPDSVAARRQQAERENAAQGPVEPFEAKLGLSAPQFAIDRQNEIVSGLKLAGRDVNALHRMSQEVSRSRMDAAASQIREYALAADPEQLGELMSKVTMDRRNKYELFTDPKTNLTTIRMGADSVSLSKPDLATFLSAQYRLRQGDAKALDEIHALDAKLAGMVSGSLKDSADVARTNNDAVSRAQGMANDTARLDLERQRLANSSAELGMRRDEAARGRMGSPLQAVDKDGNLTYAVPVMGSDGSVTVKPFDMGGLKLPQQNRLDAAAMQRYRDAVMEMPARPPGPSRESAAWDAKRQQLDQLYGMGGQSDSDRILAALAGIQKKADSAAPAQTTRTQPVQDNLEPRTQAEWRVVQAALQRGLRLVGRGNSVTGAGELLFEDRNGNRVWASAL